MYTLGHSFMPPGIHAGGLRYHGMAPMVSLGASLGLDRGGGVPSGRVFRGGHSCSPPPRGSIPAPETSHAIRARDRRGHPQCRETGEEKCILFNLSGHGLCDMGSYDRFLSNKLDDYAYPQEKIEEAIAELPVIE